MKVALSRLQVELPRSSTGAMAAKLKELQSDLSTLKDVTLENARRCQEIWATRWMVRCVGSHVCFVIVENQVSYLLTFEVQIQQISTNIFRIS